MKNIKITTMDLLALILMVLSFFLPFLSPSISINLNTLLLLTNCYLIAYFAYLISFMDTKKVILMALPLVLYSSFLVFFIRDFKPALSRAVFDDLSYIITNFFDLAFVVMAFFILEFALNRVFGSKFTMALAVVSLAFYLVLINTKIIPFDFYYKDLLLYFSFFVMASKIKPANRISPFLFILAIGLCLGEIYLYKYLNFYPGMYFSTYVLTYFVLKASQYVEATNLLRYMNFSYLYPYHLNYIILKSYVDASGLVVTILAILTTYLFGQILYRLRLKFLDYLFVGIH